MFYEKKKGYGLPRYTFKNICAENNSVNLDDKCVKVVYNAKAYESVEDPKVRALLRFIQTDEPGEDDYSKRLSEFVAKAKENEKFRKAVRRYAPLCIGEDYTCALASAGN